MFNLIAIGLAYRNKIYIIWLNELDLVAVLEALNRKYRDLEIKRSESVTKSTVEACQIPPVIVNNRAFVASLDMPLVYYADKFWHATQRKLTGLVGLVANAVEDANQWMRQQFGCDMAVDASLLEWEMF